MDKTFIEEFVSRTDDLIKYTVISAEHLTSHQKEYGSGQLLTMVEMHTLQRIADHPGIGPGDLAKAWNRTPGAVSQIVQKLQDKGFIVKEKKPENKKRVYLYPTKAGEDLTKAHRQWDLDSWGRVLERMLERYSGEELRAFLEILDAFMQEAQKNEGIG